MLKKKFPRFLFFVNFCRWGKRRRKKIKNQKKGKRKMKNKKEERRKIKNKRKKEN